MPRPCVVDYCKNIGNHRFPADESRRAQWIEAIKYIKPGLTIRKFSFICSAHFRQKDFLAVPAYLKNSAERKILKRAAVPSVFSWTTNAKELEQQNQCHQQEHQIPLIFDPSKSQQTYSRPPPVAFVEIQSFLDPPTDIIEDPLQVQSHEEEFQERESVTNNVHLLKRRSRDRTSMQRKSRINIDKDYCALEIKIDIDDVTSSNTDGKQQHDTWIW